MSDHALAGLATLFAGISTLFALVTAILAYRTVVWGQRAWYEASKAAKPLEETAERMEEVAQLQRDSLAMARNQQRLELLLARLASALNVLDLLVEIGAIGTRIVAFDDPDDVLMRLRATQTFTELRNRLFAGLYRIPEDEMPHVREVAECRTYEQAKEHLPAARSEAALLVRHLHSEIGKIESVESGAGMAQRELGK